MMKDTITPNKIKNVIFRTSSKISALINSIFLISFLIANDCAISKDSKVGSKPITLLFVSNAK